MSEEFVTHELVSLDCRGDVFPVNANGNPHKHVLWSLNDFSIDFQQVTPFKGFEPKVVVVKIPLEINDLVQLFIMFLNDVVDTLIEQRSRSVAFIFAIEKLVGHISD